MRDTWELWHTSPQVFFDEILQRGKTIILSPQVLANPDKDWVRLHKIDDAFRGRVHSLTVRRPRIAVHMLTFAAGAHGLAPRVGAAPGSVRHGTHHLQANRA